MTAAVLKAEDPLMSAFAPAEGSYPIQTPYGSIQLNHASAQQTPAITFLGVPGADSDEEEEEDDDDDEDGTSKGKRKRSKSTSSKSGGKKTAAKGAAASSAAGVGTSGERDSHTGRRKIRIEFIEDDSRRHITFSKRKAGIMKKAYELATLTGTQVLLLIVSQTGLVYTFTTPKLSPVVQEAEGRELIQSCLNAPEPEEHSQNVNEVGIDSNEGEETTEDSDQGISAHNPYNTTSQQQQQQQQAHHPDLFQDPRNAMGIPAHMSNLAMNMPHLHGLSYGGYPGHHMNMHDQAIPYGTYGM